MKCFAAAIAAAIAIICIAAPAGAGPADIWAGLDASGESIATTVTPVAIDSGDPDRTQFGRLRLMAALEISSDDDRFGGVSGYRLSPDAGRFLSISDRGSWIWGTLTYDAGRLTGVKDLRVESVHGALGRKLASGMDDAEAVSLTSDPGKVAVSFEQMTRVCLYALGGGGAAVAAGKEIPSPSIAAIQNNRAVEALALAPDGAFIAIAEDTRSHKGPFPAWRLAGGEEAPFALARHGNFRPTDAEFGPDGRLYVLERKFSLFGWFGMRLLRIDMPDEIGPDTVLDGEPLIELDRGSGIDNMEGISVRADAEGRLTIQMISDDNFMPFQRTLLLQFEAPWDGRQPSPQPSSPSAGAVDRPTADQKS